jgi:DHA1 family bicyclomycin/chloramphenicol resistance-like MFS transporter
MSGVHNPQRLIVLLAALQAFVPLSIDMYLPGLPAMGTALHAEEPHMQLTISVFLIGLFFGMLLYGPLSDKYGRRPLLLFGMTLYLISSIGCALVSSADQLITLRLFQALGGGAASVLGRALVRDLFPLQEAARVLSLMHLVTMIATLIAPLLGHYVMQALGWRALFYVLATFSSLVLLFYAIKIPETHPPAAQQSSVWAAYRAYGRIATDRQAMTLILCMSLSFAGMFTYITASPFIYIDYFALDQSNYAWLFSINIVSIIFFVLINAKAVRTIPTATMLLIGAVISFSSALFIGYWSSSSQPNLTGIVIGLLGYVGVTGMIGANCIALLLRAYPNNAGAASGLAISVQFGSGALFSTLTSTLYTGTPLVMGGLITLCGTIACMCALAYRYLEKSQNLQKRSIST